MQYVYIIVLGLHVLAGVFWAGTTIAVARDPEIRIERFFRPQMNAAGMVFLTGALLWYFFHSGSFGSMEMVLALGIATALIAAGDAFASCHLRAQLGFRRCVSAGGLLVITVLCMATARMF